MMAAALDAARAEARGSAREKFSHREIGTKAPELSSRLGQVAFRAGGAAQWGVSVQELPLVLVIEDDPEIQIVVEDALAEGGFESAIAASGEEAVTLLKGGLLKYRALVTDVKLKGRMDGWEVAKQSREIDPAFPIVYITGAAVGRWASRGVPNSILLEKPFAPAQLVTAVSNLLNMGTSTP
jgi:CheY-like chemotaxis protein